MADDIVELSTEIETLKNKIASNDEKKPEEYEAKILKQIDDEKKAKVIISRMKEQMNKQ